MPDASSAEAARRAGVAGEAAPSRSGGLPLSAPARAVMIACGFIPLLHAFLSIAPAALVLGGVAGWRVLLLIPVLLYGLPPLVVGLAVRLRPIARGAFEPGSSAFLWWWFTAQWQVLFARLPLLEELLRLVPGLYSAWLRAWGARVGALVYWSPGVVMTDRPLVRIGDRVVVGFGVRLAAHAVAPARDGRQRLHVAAIEIGSDAVVGGYSLVLPGCRVAAGEATPPLRTLHHFTTYAGGRRIRRGESAGLPEDRA